MLNITGKSCRIVCRLNDYFLLIPILGHNSIKRNNLIERARSKLHYCALSLLPLLFLRFRVQKCSWDCSVWSKEQHHLSGVFPQVSAGLHQVAVTEGQRPEERGEQSACCSPQGCGNDLKSQAIENAKANRPSFMTPEWRVHFFKTLCPQCWWVN